MFKKIFDEIKYICKVVTAGSKEARQLEKVKKTFEEAYRQKNNTATNDGVKYSVEYSNYEANDALLDFVDKVKDGKIKANEKFYFDTVSEKNANKIYELTGVDVTNFKIAIEARQIEHILKDHGINSKSDKSMADDLDIARMEYTISNPDEISNSGRTQAYTYMKNGRNRTAPTVLLEKSIGEKSYYVVEAIADTKAKTVYIVTAFIGDKGYKKETSQLTDTKSPNVTSKNGSANVSNDIISNSAENVKKKQLEIINKHNPAPNTYNTWVRSVDDIKTFEEALADDEIAEYDEFNPDFDRAMAEQAIKDGEITVYSSYPIKQGVFVSPSYMEAESYSGDGTVYSKRVPLDSVAWIDITQGQYADTKTDDIKMSLSTANDDIGPVREHNNVYGEDIKLQVDGPVREDIAPGEATTENSIINGDEPIKATQSAETTKSSTHEDLVNQMSDIMDEANKSDTKANTVSQEFIDNSNKSFGIEKPNDYVHVQKQVFNTLKNEGFFTGEDNSRIDYNEDSGMVIETNRSGIKETFNFANYSNLGKTKKAIKLATIRKLPEIIKNSKLVDNDVNNYHSDNSSTKFAYIQSTIDVDGNDVSVQIDIKKSPQKNKFWVHRVYVLEKANELPAVASGAIKQAIDSSAYEDSLPNPNEDVKEDLPDYFVDSENKQKTKLTRKSLHEDIIFVYGCIKNYFNI